MIARDSARGVVLGEHGNMLFEVGWRRNVEDDFQDGGIFEALLVSVAFDNSVIRSRFSWP